MAKKYLPTAATRLRILPLTILFLFLVLLLRVGGFFQEYYLFRINKAHAATVKEERQDLEPPQSVKAIGPPTDLQPPLAKASDEENTQATQAIKEVLSFSGIEEIKIVQDILNAQKDLESKRQELESKETVLNALRKQVTEQVAQVEKAQKNQTNADKGNQEAEKRVEEVSKTFGNMKGAEAARILAQLDLDYATKIIAKMSPMKQAPILAALPQERAKQITERMIRA